MSRSSSDLPTDRVPMIHLCDKTDPWFDYNTRVVEQGYKELGGPITVVTNANDPRAPAVGGTNARGGTHSRKNK